MLFLEGYYLLCSQILNCQKSDAFGHAIILIPYKLTNNCYYGPQANQFCSDAKQLKMEG